MSAGKHIKPDSLYLKELIALRTEGYSWVAIGRYFGKDHTTIQYHWNRWVGKPSRTTKRVQTIEKLRPSWNGEKHLCCNSFLHKMHFQNCPNVQGTWYQPDNFKDIKAVVVNKYDHILDDSKRVGKSYQQFILRK